MAIRFDASNIINRMETCRRHFHHAKKNDHDNQANIARLKKELAIAEGNANGLHEEMNRRRGDLDAAVSQYLNAGDWLKIEAVDPEPETKVGTRQVFAGKKAADPDPIEVAPK